MDQMMQNPQMMQMAQMMMQDPEVLEMMQQPGMMEKLQAAMANPASAMGDPDVMKIAMKLQGMGMGGGGGGMGGGMGGYGNSPTAPAGSSGGAAQIQHVKTSAALAALLAGAGKKLVVVDYFTTWCGPCKMIAPLFQELASQYSATVVFVKVDGDQARELCAEKGIQGFPTFEFYISGSKVDSFSGADQGRLRRNVEQHAEPEPEVAPCPWKHFPLREAELVKYADIKWEMVAPKFREFSAKFAAAGDAANELSEAELKSVDGLLKVVQERANYHSSTVSADQFAVLNKLLTWPKDSLGPVLNLVRMAVFHPAVAKYYADQAQKRGSADLLPTLLKIAHCAEKSVTAMLVVRSLANTFHRRALGKAVAGRFEDVLESVAALYKKHADENLRLSIIALYINYSVLFSEDSKYFDQAKVLLLTSVQEALQQVPIEPKIAYRSVVIIGTIAYSDANATELARDLDVLDAVNAAAKDPACKADAPMQQATAELTQLLQAK